MEWTWKMKDSSTLSVRLQCCSECPPALARWAPGRPEFSLRPGPSPLVCDPVLVSHWSVPSLPSLWLLRTGLYRHGLRWPGPAAHLQCLQYLRWIRYLVRARCGLRHNPRLHLIIRRDEEITIGDKKGIIKVIGERDFRIFFKFRNIRIQRINSFICFYLFDFLGKWEKTVQSFSHSDNQTPSHQYQIIDVHQKYNTHLILFYYIVIVLFGSKIYVWQA